MIFEFQFCHFRICESLITRGFEFRKFANGKIAKFKLQRKFGFGG